CAQAMRTATSSSYRPARQGNLLAVTFALLVASGCSEAEHLNPLDPLSPDFENVGVVEGLVTDRGFAPLGGVEARLEPLGITTQSAADGTFSFGGVAPGDYTLALSGSGLQSTAE